MTDGDDRFLRSSEKRRADPLYLGMQSQCNGIVGSVLRLSYDLGMNQTVPMEANPTRADIEKALQEELKQLLQKVTSHSQAEEAAFKRLRAILEELDSLRNPPPPQ
jgi:dsDNA-specific endonuclease/ATPase MutS2